MATIKFEDGTTVKFEGTPTPQDVEEVANNLGIRKQPQPLFQTTQAQVKKEPFVQRFGRFLGLEGLGKGIGQAIFFQSPEGRRFLRDVEKSPELAQTAVGTGALDIVKPTEVLGSAAQTALTVATAGGAGTAGKIIPRIFKTAGLGAGFAGGGQLQEEGKITPGRLTGGAVFGGALPVVGAGLGLTGRAITQMLPKRLIQSAVGQTKAVLLAGKDISEFVLQKRRMGTANQLIESSRRAIEKLGQQIQTNLQNVPEKTRVLRSGIISEVVKRINQEGGKINASEVTSVINKLAPQAKGFLSKPFLTLQEANKLRQSLDKTLGDRAFLTTQLPFNKGVLRLFDSALRERVKDLAPAGTREIFSELSKEITLRNSLLERYAGRARNEVVNAFDLILAGGGFLGGGAPGGIGALAIKKGIQSPLGKTAIAQTFGFGGEVGRKLQPILQKLNPAERTLILNLIGEVSSPPNFPTTEERIQQ